jgi:hypothetical protein
MDCVLYARIGCVLFFCLGLCHYGGIQTSVTVTECGRYQEHANGEEDQHRGKYETVLTGNAPTDTSNPLHHRASPSLHNVMVSLAGKTC